MTQNNHSSFDNQITPNHPFLSEGGDVISRGGSLNLLEQETIVSRVRNDRNKVLVYSSDTRVISKLLKLHPDCEKIYNASYKGVGEHKGLVAVRCELDVAITRKGGILFPLYRGDKNE